MRRALHERHYYTALTFDSSFECPKRARAIRAWRADSGALRFVTRLPDMRGRVRGRRRRFPGAIFQGGRAGYRLTFVLHGGADIGSGELTRRHSHRLFVFVEKTQHARLRQAF